MSGSRPDAVAVTASGGTWSWLTPSRLAMNALRAVIWPYSTSLSWDMLDAPDAAGLMSPKPSAVLSVNEKSDACSEGRVWKYRSLVGSFFAFGSIGLVPIRLDPTGCPWYVTTEPSARLSRPGIRETAHTDNG